MNKEYVSWADIEFFVQATAAYYQDTKITGVYGLPRGGLIFAVMLSHQMNIPLLMTPIDNCIIIDDICDSGESLLHYYKDSSNSNDNKYHIVTMHYKKNDLVKPEFYLFEKEDKWIVYPWEVE